MNKPLAIYDRFIGVRLASIVFFTLLFLIIIFGIFYYTGNLESPSTLLFGGLLASFIAVLVQFLMNWNEHRENEKIKSLAIRKILPNRMDKEYYESLVRGASKRVDVLGVTATRFLTDFLDENSNQHNALIAALATHSHLRARILIADPAYLETEIDIGNANVVKAKIRQLTQQHSRLKFKYYSHIPTHNIVCVDDEAIVGPVFPKKSSKDTPSIHASTNSPFVKFYLEYFEEQWLGAIDAN